MYQNNCFGPSYRYGEDSVNQLINYLIWSHITIFLFLLYQHLWKNYIDSKISKENTLGKEISNSLLIEESNESISEELFVKKNTENIPSHFLEYLEALGSDHFGKSINILLKDESNKNVLFLNNEEIKSMNPVQLQKYLLKLFSFEADYVKFKLQLPDEINYLINKKDSNKDIMVEYITNLKYTLENWDNNNTKNSIETMLSGMIPMMSMFASEPKKEILMDSTDKLEEISDKKVEIEEISELEKEMGLVLNS